uniref:Amino acid-binding ACT domain protein n=1 Tax=Methanococcus maripaludis (strain C6 / ATCC BAA-1332) TaxID=444158 RepID=A9A6P9_METM6
MQLGLTVIAEDRVGILYRLTGIISELNANIVYTQQFIIGDNTGLIYMELDGVEDEDTLVEKLEKLEFVKKIEIHKTMKKIFGKRVLIFGGGAQVSQVAMGAISEADRHNIRGERISVDTMAVVGEENLADAILAIKTLPRAGVLVLAGSLMGGEITKAVEEVKKDTNIPVICLNMFGSLPKIADLIVTDPLQAGVIAVMTVADTAKFDINKVRGKIL